MPSHHSRIEHVLIHFVAILFTFSAVVSAFLGYGIFQSNQQLNDGFTIAPTTQAASSYWTQTSWAGGTSSSTYTVSWGSSGGWNKYASGNGLSVSSTVTIADGGELVSSKFNLGNKRLWQLWPTGNANVDLFVRGSNSATGLDSTSWSSKSCSISKYKYVQYKLENNSGSSTWIDGVGLGHYMFNVSGIVKDASSGKGISGASVNYGSGSTTSAFNYNESVIKPVLAAGATGSYHLSVNFIPSTSLTIKVSKSGYTTQTKTASIPSDGCAGNSKTINFSLTKSSSDSGSSGSSSSSSGSTSTSSGTGTALDTSSTVSLSEFQSVKLPKIFLAKGSKTTNLAKVKNHKKIKDFTLHVVNKNKIVFKETLNLSTQKTIGLLKKLDKYVKMSTAGKIELDSKAFAALNKKATLTMEKLKHISTPEVLVGGKKDTKGIVDSISYDKNKGVLSFNVAHFTYFEAAPKLELTSPPDGTTTEEENPIIRGKISDPNATVTGRFNEVDLAPITPDKESGEFVINNLMFKEGGNFLTLEAKSDLGKVLPVVATINYNPSGAAGPIISGGSNTQTAILATVLIGSLAFLVLLGYLVYRKRKHSKKADTVAAPALHS